jgi:hypothetical protein
MHPTNPIVTTDNCPRTVFLHILTAIINQCLPSYMKDINYYLEILHSLPIPLPLSTV